MLAVTYKNNNLAVISEGQRSQRAAEKIDYY